MVEEVFTYCTSVKVTITQCKNTLALHSILVEVGLILITLCTAGECNL